MSDIKLLDDYTSKIKNAILNIKNEYLYMFVKLTQIYMCMILLDEHWRKEVINYEILSKIKSIKRRQRFNATEYCGGIVC